MVKSKEAFNLTVIWGVIFLILIVVSFVFFFLLDSFNEVYIDQENLYEEDVHLEIKDFNPRNGGVDFILEINPKKNEIIGIIFTFEDAENQSEKYFSNVSYICSASELYTIDLIGLFPKKVVKVTMEPLVTKLENPPHCLPFSEIENSLDDSKERIENFFSRFSRK